MTRAKEQLVPITDKVYHQTFKRSSDPTSATRRECWGATTEDGVWRFERIEIPGTPWDVYHIPTGAHVSTCGSLAKCRRYVTRGYAQAELEALSRNGSYLTNIRESW